MLHVACCMLCACCMLHAVCCMLQIRLRIHQASIQHQPHAKDVLRAVGLQEAAHQYSLRDMCSSTRTPTLPTLHTPELQFTNLQRGVSVRARLPASRVRETLKTWPGSGTRRVCGHWGPEKIGIRSIQYPPNGPRLCRLWVDVFISPLHPHPPTREREILRGAGF